MYGVQESREIVRIDIGLVEAQDWGKVSSLLAQTKLKVLAGTWNLRTHFLDTPINDGQCRLQVMVKPEHAVCLALL